MTDRYLLIAPADQIRHHLTAIEDHLARLANGHDPHGHLLAIERLARAARAEWTPSVAAAAARRR